MGEDYAQMRVIYKDIYGTGISVSSRATDTGMKIYTTIVYSTSITVVFFPLSGKSSTENEHPALKKK